MQADIVELCSQLTAHQHHYHHHLITHITRGRFWELLTRTFALLSSLRNLVSLHTAREHTLLRSERQLAILSVLIMTGWTNGRMRLCFYTSFHWWCLGWLAVLTREEWTDGTMLPCCMERAQRLTVELLFGHKNSVKKHWRGTKSLSQLFFLSTLNWVSVFKRQ